MLPKIKIGLRNHLQPMSATNCVVWVDGQEMKGIVGIEFKLNVNDGYPKVKLTMRGDIEIDGQFAFTQEHEKFDIGEELRHI